jgi:hypothetical protein
MLSCPGTAGTSSADNERYGGLVEGGRNLWLDRIAQNVVGLPAGASARSTLKSLPQNSFENTRVTLTVYVFK